MPFEHVEELKREYTDKYVVVDATRPELARFANATGQVKTVNMSGRALVQFDQYDNTGWYDIELDFLKVVPKPEPKPAGEKAAPVKKVAGEAPVAKAGSPAKAGGKPSTADILAAARAKAGAPASAGAAPEAKPAAAKPAVAKPAAGGKMSTADILAAARAKAASAAAPSSTVERTAAAEEVAQPAASPIAKAKPAAKAPVGALPTTIPEKIEYCRRVDAK